MAAVSAIRSNPDLKALNDRLRAAGKAPKVALTWMELENPARFGQAFA